MPDRARILAGLGGAIAAVTCCAAPVLAVTLGTAGLAAWLGRAGHVLVPALILGAGLIGAGLYRRQRRER